MNDGDVGVLNFGAFAIDLDAGQISTEEGAVQVEPQVFDLISLFCRKPGRLISHDEIIEQVWNGRIVSDSAIATRINAARKALGDDGTAQKVIKTVRGRGFRFELAPEDNAPDPLQAPLATDNYESGRFVLSCTPYGHSLLMATRHEVGNDDWRTGLSKLLGEAADKTNGKVEGPHLAIFDSAADAINCATSLRSLVEHRCDLLPRKDRWTTKTGIAYGTTQHGFAFALAGRLDALAYPGGLCVTKRVLREIQNGTDCEAVAVDENNTEEDTSAFRVTRLDDLVLTPQDLNQPAQTAYLDIPEPNEISVIALPFEVLGDDDELQQIAVGLRLEIQNALAQLSGVLPMAAGTAAAFAGQTSPDTAKALGLRYVLQGNMRAIGRRVRLMLELYDHERGGVTWSQSYDGSLDDGFEFQDEMTKRVVRALDVKVLSGEQARIWHRNFSNLKAIPLQYSGMRDFFRMTKECMRSARESFERLHNMHPEVSTGATWLSLCHWFEIQRGWSDDTDKSIEAVKYWANIARPMEDADGQAHTALCHVHLLKREFDAALEVGDEAVTVRPSCANANGFYAHSLYFCGNVDKAIHHARLAIRFSPAYPPLFAAVLAGALHARGDHSAAIAISKDALRLNQQDGHARVILCSALMASELTTEAQSVAVDLQRMEPDFEVQSFLMRLPFRNAEMRSQLSESYSKAIEAAGQAD